MPGIAVEPVVPPVISGENTGPTKHRALELVLFQKFPTGIVSIQ